MFDRCHFAKSRQANKTKEFKNQSNIISPAAQMKGVGSAFSQSIHRQQQGAKLLIISFEISFFFLLIKEMNNTVHIKTDGALIRWVVDSRAIAQRSVITFGHSQ